MYVGFVSERGLGEGGESKAGPGRSPAGKGRGKEAQTGEGAREGAQNVSVITEREIIIKETSLYTHQCYQSSYC